MKMTIKIIMKRTWGGALQKVSLDGGLKRVSHPVTRFVIKSSSSSSCSMSSSCCKKVVTNNIVQFGQIQFECWWRGRPCWGCRGRFPWGSCSGWRWGFSQHSRTPRSPRAQRIVSQIQGTPEKRLRWFLACKWRMMMRCRLYCRYMLILPRTSTCLADF